MREVTLRVEDLDSFSEGALAMGRRLDEGANKVGVAKLAFESMAGLLKLLTANRWTLMATLRPRLDSRPGQSASPRLSRRSCRRRIADRCRSDRARRTWQGQRAMVSHHRRNGFWRGGVTSRGTFSNGGAVPGLFQVISAASSISRTIASAAARGSAARVTGRPTTR